MRILRTKCDFDWTTPFGTVRTLPINCAYDSSETWASKFWYVRTIGTANPNTVEFLSDGPDIEFAEFCDEGQIVFRCFFAYVATDPITTNIELSATAAPPWNEDGTGYQLRENISLTAKLYDPSTSLIETYIDTDGHTASGAFTLPATICPKVVWLNASIQPTGIPPWQPNLPSTGVLINFNTPA